MTLDPTDPSSVYAYPRYYALGYRWNTTGECDFLEACLRTHAQAVPAKKPSKPATKTPTTPKSRILDIGCGAGRHMIELAKRGHHVTGFDSRREMVDYVKSESRRERVAVDVSVGDLANMRVAGTFDLAICLMDTFRFLLINEQIITHLRRVADRLRPGGVYVTDFWVPMQWDQVANEVYQWEQTEDDTTVRVFYLQHPETVDPVQQTFEDQLVFVVDEDGASQEIAGARTRTRLILPQEFRALVEASGGFDTLAAYADFDVSKPLEPTSQTWRMVTVLKKRG